MRAHWVHVERDFSAPPERVFAYLAEHENLASVFGAKVTRLRDGYQSRNGVGSVRQLVVGPGLPPFEETVQEFEPSERIVYRITKGSPIDNHVGIMEFTPTPSGGTHLDYRIRLSSKIPGLAGVVKLQLTRSVTSGLAEVEASA